MDETNQDVETQPSPLRRGVSFGVGSFAVNAFLALITSVAVARIYGADLIGQYALAYAPTGVLLVLSTIREQPAMIRELAILERRSAKATAVFVATFLFSEGLTAVMAVVIGAVSYFVFQAGASYRGLFVPAAVLLAGNVVFTNPSWNLDSLFGAFQAGGQLFTIRVTMSCTYLVTAVAIAYLWPRSVWSLIVASLIPFATGLTHRLLLMGAYVTRHVSRLDLAEGRARLRPMIRWSAKLIPGGLADGLGLQSAIWVLGFQVPVPAVGAYSRMWQLSYRLFDLNFRIVEMVFPALVRRVHAGDLEGFERAQRSSQRLSTVILLLPAAVGAGASTAIASVFGGGFTSAAGALAFLLFVPCLASICSLQGNALMALNKLWPTTWLVLLRFVAILALLVPLSAAFGLPGAGAAVALGYALDVVATSITARSLIDAFPPFSSFGWLRLTAASVAGYASARLIQSILGAHPLTVLVAVPVGAVCYTAVVLASRWFTDDERREVQRIAERAFRRPLTWAGETT